MCSGLSCSSDCIDDSNDYTYGSENLEYLCADLGSTLDGKKKGANKPPLYYDITNTKFSRQRHKHYQFLEDYIPEGSFFQGFSSGI